eukprot:gene3003-3451_t
MNKKLIPVLGLLFLGPLLKAQDRYTGSFVGKDPEGTSTTLFLDQASGYFSTYVESKEKEKLFFASGSFKVKNDKAFLTTAPEYDAIKVYGRYNPSLDKDSVRCIVASRKGKTVLEPISVAIGEDPSKKQWKGVTSEGLVQESGGYRLDFKKSDSLWVDYALFDHISYGFQINAGSGKKYNEFFIDADDYLSSLMLIAEGLSRAKNDVLSFSPMDKNAYAKHPPHVVVLHMTGLWLRKGLVPVTAEPPVLKKITFDEQVYEPLERAALTRTKVKRLVQPPLSKKAVPVKKKP